MELPEENGWNWGDAYAFSNIEKVMADDASIYVFHAGTEGLNFRKAFDAAKISGIKFWLDEIGVFIIIAQLKNIKTERFSRIL